VERYGDVHGSVMLTSLYGIIGHFGDESFKLVSHLHRFRTSKQNNQEKTHKKNKTKTKQTGPKTYKKTLTKNKHKNNLKWHLVYGAYTSARAQLSKIKLK